MRIEKGRTWKNDAGNQAGQPLRQYWPESLEDIRAVIQEAERLGVCVRGTGSGHSWSDVALTTGFQVMPQRLNRPLELDEEAFKDGVDTSTLVNVESGMTIRELNDFLDSRGLALPNMGGYDAQTIIGATSTSTHGSGIEHGPLCDLIESLVLVGEGGVVYQVEPTEGITDPEKFDYDDPDYVLVQNNDWFDAVIVGMGCMGIIYSVVLRVTQSFWLKEVRTLSTWEEVKRDLRAGQVLRDNDHYEVLLNPHEIDGRHLCLITTRNRTSEPQGLPPDKTERNFLSEFIASLPIFRKILKRLFGIIPEIQDDVIDEVMRSLVDDAYIHKSYKVFNIGQANEIPAISAEIGFPLKGGRYIDAIDRFLEMVDDHRSIAGLYHTAPVSLRFVKATRAFLSMMHGYDTCMMEIIFSKDTPGTFEMLDAYERELYRFSGRPHWGQINGLTHTADLIGNMYPAFDRWLRVHSQLCRKGTFESSFTRRLGIFSANFVPAHGDMARI